MRKIFRFGKKINLALFSVFDVRKKNANLMNLNGV